MFGTTFSPGHNFSWSGGGVSAPSSILLDFVLRVETRPAVFPVSLCRILREVGYVFICALPALVLPVHIIQIYCTYLHY